MDEPKKPLRPEVGPKEPAPTGSAGAREAKLAAALRANLKRRKSAPRPAGA
ncbi:MAG: hypothetical protein ACHP7N_00470 [Caulobacterales bacterium]